jgi:ATPase subunit of ABC transporter with duplicated ATPase domains
MYQVKNISKAFADKQVLDSVSFALNNEVVALIGENGAGKTTLLRIMLGEIEQDDGQMLSGTTSVGYVPQHPELEATIIENFDNTTEQWQIDIALEDVGLRDIPLDFATSLLSGGQKTRLAIARVLAQSPSPGVLLLDEPTNNLDTEGLCWLEKFIHGFVGSVIIVSHDRSFINRICR